MSPNRIFLCLASVLLTASTARAGSNLDCIEASKGRKISWNSSWSTDKLDNNVEYRVVRAEPFNKIPTRQVTLELVAVGSAHQTHRTAVVATEDRARAICERIVEEKAPLRFPDQVESDVDSLPFIRYTREGWVRAPMDKDAALVLCRVGELRFSCPDTDRQRYGANLRTLEEELKSQVAPQ